MDKDEIVEIVQSVLFIGIIILIFGYITLSIGLHEDAMKESCKKMGFESYRSGDIPYCVDYKGNLHYIDGACEGLFFNKCPIREISVGDVRVVEKW